MSLTGAERPVARAVALGTLPLVVGSLVLLLTPHGVEAPARWSLAITAGALMAWVTEAIPLTSTSIPIIFFLAASGAVPPNDAVSGFGSAATLLLVAGFMMAAALQNTPLAQRLTYHFLLRSPLGSSGVLAGLLAALVVLAVFVPSTVVRAVALLPVVVALAQTFIRHGSPNGAKRLMLGLAFGATLGGIAFLPAAVVNVLAVDLVASASGERITYFEWLALAWPVEVLAFLALWSGLVLLFPTPQEQPLDRATIADRLSELGALTGAERRLAVILVLTATLWSAESVTGWHPAVPAFLAVALMTVSPIRVVEWEAVLDIQWGSVLLFGASLSLAFALRDTGGARWLGEWLLGAGAVSVARLATFVLPSQAMSNLVTYETGLYTAGDLRRVGLLLTLVFVAILGAAGALWWGPLGFLR